MPERRRRLVRRRALRLAQLFALIVAVISAVALAGWSTGRGGMVHLWLGGRPMMVNSALGLGVCALAISASLLGRSGRVIGIAGFALIGVLGLAQAVQDVFDVELGLDQALWPDFTAAADGAIWAPGRMSLATAGLLVLLALGGAFTFARGRRFLLSQSACVASLALGMHHLFLAVYDVVPAQEPGESGPMAAATALAAGCAALSLCYANPDRGIGAMLIGSSGSSQTLRRMLATLLIAPLVIGWIAVSGQNNGLFPRRLTISLISSGVTLVTTAVLAWTVRAIRDGEADLQAALEEIEKRERVFRSSFENAFVGMAHVDRQGRWLRVNDCLTAILQCSANELIGRSVAADVAAEDWPALQKLMEGQVNGARDSGTVLSRWRSRRGKALWLEAQFSGIRDGYGVLEMHMLVLQDVTRELSREEMLRIRTRGLEVAGVAVSIADASVPDLPLVYVNEEFERLTGYSEHEVLGRNCRFLNERARDQVALRELRSAIAEARECTVELLNHTKSGTAQWVQLSVAPVHSERGSLTHYIGIHHDISERVKAAEEREALLARALADREQAFQATQARDKFLAMVSHELRSPLNSVHLWSELLRERGPGDGAFFSQAMGHIVAGVALQAHLVEDLLDISRIASGKLDMEFEDLDLDELVRSTVESVRPRAEHGGISLSIHGTGGAVLVRGDSKRLQQAVRNLLENAFKFTPGGGRVDVSLSVVGDQVLIEVRDNGRGLSAYERERVLEPFWRSQRRAGQAEPGLGLGLSIVDHVLARHGGRIEVESPGEGRGSTFRLRLPLGGAAPADGEANEPAASGASPSSVDPVLIVDDDRAAAEALALALTASGVAARFVHDVPAARAEIARHRPRALISDVMMPAINGIEFVQELRRDEELGGLARIRAVAVSAHGGPEARREALAAGFDAFMSKPVDLAELRSWVLGAVNS